MADTEEDNSPLKSTGFWLFKDPDPGFGQTCISIGANFILSNMLLYGLTGRGRLSYLLSMATIPCSLVMCLQDSQKDYEKWKEMKLLRLKGIPERFMPYKCKYDWTDFDRRKLQEEINKK